MKKTLSHADVTEAGYIRWAEDGDLPERSPHSGSW